MVRNAYPPRDGDQKWPLALSRFAAARKGGEPLEIIVEGVARYASYCETKGWVGTEYVKQAATFFGVGQCWREKWAPSLRSPSRQARDSNFGRAADGFVG